MAELLVIAIAGILVGLMLGYVAAIIMDQKGRNPWAGFYLGFFLSFLGVALAIICPESPERQAQAIAQALATPEDRGHDS